ncbi:hypothetical protein SGRI78S_02374 [Streptomyces griseus subsp. griseus]
MFGLGGTHGSPVSSKKSERRHPDIVTTSSRTGCSRRNSALKNSASSATVIPCAWAISRRPTNVPNAGSSTGPSAARPVTGFGRSSTTRRLPASAAASMQSYSVQMYV